MVPSAPLHILTSSRNTKELRPALFVDRDDTIIVNRPYLSDPAGVELMAGAAEGLRAFQEAGYWLIMVSNQSGIGRGYFTSEALMAVHQQVVKLLEEQGVFLDGTFYCPHAPEENCSCRKPQTGLLDAARQHFAVDMTRSLMVGDKGDDVRTGLNAGIGAAQILVSADRTPAPGAHLTAASILEVSRQWLTVEP